MFESAVKFQVHGGSPIGQNNSRYRIPKYPICAQAEAGRLFRKYKNRRRVAETAVDSSAFRSVRSSDCFVFRLGACLLAFSIAQWFGIACSHVIPNKFRSSCCRSKDITILECAVAFCCSIVFHSLIGMLMVFLRGTRRSSYR
jgi:hypothetical protein